MSEPFIAEVKMWGLNFAPRGWAFCDGQLLPISQNTALFSLVGTTYGGDGRTTLALPDLRGRTPIHGGTGSGLSTRRLGQKLGTETNILTENQMPNHTHTVQASVNNATAESGNGNVLAQTSANLYHSGGSSNISLNNRSVANSGANQPINNMQPFLTINFCIALVGLYPSRS